MNKKELVAYIATKNKCSQEKARNMINIVLDGAIEALGKSGELVLVGFGSFYVGSVKARKGRNPKSGAPMDIAPYKRISFRAGKCLRKVCN